MSVRKILKGNVVSVNGEIGVVTHTSSELEWSDHDNEHIGVWFGEVKNDKPNIKTLPLEYCKLVDSYEFYH